jgi:PKD repeat protein
MRVSLPERGEYKVHLEVLDNETNITSEDYTIVVSDPVAIIKTNPEKGNTSTMFSFDGGPSYSVLSSLKVYTWELFDQNGNKLETYQGKSIKQQFKKPGFYIVKLTVEDELGQTNTDNMQIYVESTEPIPQFTITPADEWKYPSRFNLDGTISTDIDKANNVDSLSYEWTFPEEAKVKIVSTDNNNGKVTAEFNAIGKFACKLSVKDDYGKLSEITRDIEVKSILRPEIIAAPQATTWNTPISFSVKSNLAIANYAWDFGD